MRTLSLDLGNMTGWAFSDAGDEDIRSGFWKLDGIDLDARCDKLRFWISTVNPDAITYERVKMRPAGLYAGESRWRFEQVVRDYCHHNKLHCYSYTVEQIKAFATGKVRATKDEMLWEAKERWGHDRVTDHNQADALHQLRLHECGGLEHVKVKGGDDGGKEAA